MPSSRSRAPRRVLVLSRSAARRARLVAAVAARADLAPVERLPAEACVIDVLPPADAARLARAALRAGIEPWILCAPGDGRTAIVAPDGARLLDRDAAFAGALGRELAAAHLRQQAVLLAVSAGARDAEDVAARLGVRRPRVVATLAAARARLGGDTLDEVIRRGLRPESGAGERAGGGGRRGSE
ncbi:MAG: hypothetical protein AB7V42_06330 [Thermoleophilia bacterium]